MALPSRFAVREREITDGGGGEHRLQLLSEVENETESSGPSWKDVQLALGKH